MNQLIIEIIIHSDLLFSNQMLLSKFNPTTIRIIHYFIRLIDTVNDLQSCCGTSVQIES